MKTIEINSSFNVIIKFNLAGVLERGVAYLIDMAVVWSVIGLISLLLYSLSYYPSDYLFLYAAVPVWGLYTPLFEIMNNGQTLGKMAMKLQVVRIDGQRTRMSDYFMRWIFKLVDLYLSAFILAILMVNASPKGQRLGDILADTTVIKVKESNKTSLDTLVNLNELKTDSVTYPQIIKLRESEMMVIKECMDSYKLYPNEGHLEAMDELIEKLEDLLEIKCLGDKTLFLKQLIRDYVILTR